MPAVRLLADARERNDVLSAGFLGLRAQEWLQASGAGTTTPLVWAQSTGPSAGQHQAGTCRMGSDPRTSVTDPWGRVWGHDGVTDRRRLAARHQRRRQPRAHHPRPRLAHQRAPRRRARAVNEVNWAGNHRYRAERIHRPSTLEEVQEIVAAAGRVRALGLAALLQRHRRRHGPADAVRAARRRRPRPGRRHRLLRRRRHLRRARRRPRRRGDGAAQPRLAPAHLGRRRDRDRHPRVRGRERQPRDGGRRAGDGDGERRGRHVPPRRPGLRRPGGRPRRARRRHPPHARRRAGLRGAPARVRGARVGPAVRALRRDHRQRLQRERADALGRRGRPGVGQEPSDATRPRPSARTSSAHARRRSNGT